jgi:hypothetical protein
MATILDLYRTATKNPVSNEIYGGDASRIESKGVINVPRQAALLVSSPNAVADLIGNQVGGLLKGSANRPSDTIFKNNQPFTKPVTIAGGFAIRDSKIKDAIEPGEKYYVKQSPAPQSIISQYRQGATSPLGMLTNTAADALKNPTATIKAVKNLTKGLKRATNEPEGYGTRFMQDKNGNIFNDDVKFSNYVPEYEKISLNGPESFVKTSKTKVETRNYWDATNDTILNNTFDENTNKNKITYVEISPYGKPATERIILPGTISGISEDYTPEWTGFKYVGSPFNVYRYSGVESSIKFNVKMYYTNESTKTQMQNSINKLKSLVFPFDELSVISYGEGSTARKEALAFSPNLLTFSVTGLYSNLFGFLEELSFTIDDNTSWATMGEDMSGNLNEPYPTVIDVSLGFKVIPKVLISNNKLLYNFDGRKTETNNITLADNEINNLFNTQNA